MVSFERIKEGSLFSSCSVAVFFSFTSPLCHSFILFPSPHFHAISSSAFFLPTLLISISLFFSVCSIYDLPGFVPLALTCFPPLFFHYTFPFFDYFNFRRFVSTPSSSPSWRHLSSDRDASLGILNPDDNIPTTILYS